VDSEALSGASPVVLIVVALLGGGFWAFAQTLLRYRPSKADQASSIIQLADKAVVVQSSVIDDLNDQLSALRTEMQAATRRIGELEREVHDLNGHLDATRRERDTAQREVERLRYRLGDSLT